MHRLIALSLFALFGVFLFAYADDAKKVDTGLVSLGKRIYLEGVGASGQPLSGTVQDGVPFKSNAMACVRCHLRSGLGSIQERVYTPRINGESLFRVRYPLRSKILDRFDRLDGWLRPKPVRPAYTDQTLREAIVNGVDSAGHKLDTVMPRFELNDEEVAGLTAYLKTLSNGRSPGVTDSVITFATIVTDDVDEMKRKSMLSVLNQYVRFWNEAASWHHPKPKIDAYFETVTEDVKLELDVWDLKGPSSSWPEQLSKLYDKKTPFALLAGISNGDWKPIHDFCEKKGLPDIFPITDFPVTEPNWYTLYLSKGIYQDGEVAMRYLQRQAATNETVVQVSDETPASQALVRAVRETREKLGLKKAVEFAVNENNKDEVFAKIQKENPRAVFVWLQSPDWKSVQRLTQGSKAPPFVFVSYSQLGDRVFEAPPSIQKKLYISYPYNLPTQKEPCAVALHTWLRLQKVPAYDENVQAKTFVLIKTLSENLETLRRGFFRDHFLETLDMNRDENCSIPVYPFLTFGPGQRYASKGGYIVQLESKHTSTTLVPKSDWVAY